MGSGPLRCPPWPFSNPGGQLRAITPTPSSPRPLTSTWPHPHPSACLIQKPNLFPRQVFPQFQLPLHLIPTPQALPGCLGWTFWPQAFHQRDSDRCALAGIAKGQGCCVSCSWGLARQVCAQEILFTWNSYETEQGRETERQRGGESKGQKARNQGTEMELDQ